MAAFATITQTRLQKRLVEIAQHYPVNTLLDPQITADIMAHDIHAMTVKLHAYVWSQPAGEKRVAFPSDWWEALKQRWFPRWALTRWPVRMREVVWKATATYPTLRMRSESHDAHIVIEESWHGM